MEPVYAIQERATPFSEWRLVCKRLTLDDIVHEWNRSCALALTRPTNSTEFRMVSATVCCMRILNPADHSQFHRTMMARMEGR